MIDNIKSTYIWVIWLALAAGSALTTNNAVAVTPHKNDGHTIHWGYSGDTGPSHWGDLTGKYALCKSGKRQSPVDIRNYVDEELYPLQFRYNSIPLQVLNNGHTLQANYIDVNKSDAVTIAGKSYPIKSKISYSSELLLGDVPYKLLQLHFHTPSEHAYQGERYAMEVHLVHKNADGNLAVIGVFLKRGKPNDVLQKILDNVSKNLNQVTVAQQISINAADLLPTNREFFHYNGSLTTPPCSENVNWFVMESPIEVSSQQANSFAQLIGENARPLQDMHWRTLFATY